MEVWPSLREIQNLQDKIANNDYRIVKKVPNIILVLLNIKHYNIWFLYNLSVGFLYFIFIYPYLEIETEMI